MRSKKVRIHRIVSWLLSIVSIITIGTGYALARGLHPDVYTLSFLHRASKILFIGVFGIHVTISSFYFGISWSKSFRLIMEGHSRSLLSARLLQRISGWLIVIFTLIMIVSGLHGYESLSPLVGTVVPFELHRIYDLFLAITVIVHVGIGFHFVFIRRRITSRVPRLVVAAISIGLILLVAHINLPLLPNGEQDIDETQMALVTIDGQSYEFNPTEVNTLRPDIFQSGHFSMFDVLVHVAERSNITLEYNYNASMNTHTITSLNGIDNWWYRAHYSGGWPENNVFRMDLYPWRNGTTLEFYRASRDFINRVHETFVEEIVRFNSNNGSVVIDEVIIQTMSGTLVFENVSVSAHNLRDDTFQMGTITAIDVMLSLHDQGEIIVELQWYDSIGTAEIVRSFWVERINEHRASGTCGFVYESGSYEFYGFQGNHIHLPSDSRVVFAPEYMRWFWICL